MVGTSCASWVYVHVLGLVPQAQRQKKPLPRLLYSTAVMPIGLSMAIAFVSGNGAYLYLSGRCAVIVGWREVKRGARDASQAWVG